MKSKRKKIFICTLLGLIFFYFVFLTKEAGAVEDPLAVPNNKFGIHILEESDLEDAASLVNSQGDWGYVTLVIRKDERDIKRWQQVLNKMRRLHLIPIVRIATRQIGGIWEKPNLDEIDGWVSFLNELNWVIKNRYVVVGNEPNHAKEWGGETKPEEYAEYFYRFSEKLKERSSDFFILHAGLDASAPNSKDTMSEDEFIKKEISYKQDLFEYIDGWASHSYPNPDSSGSQDATGRGSIRTFEWELEFLKGLGIKKELPVFITETGWAHSLEANKEVSEDTEQIAGKLKAAYEIAWRDSRIVAVTPFVLNYQDPPFDIFSWKKKDGSFYNFYYQIKDLPKPKGTPIQIVSIDILSFLFPPIIPSEGSLTGVGVVKNTGQNIWEGNEEIYAPSFGFEVKIEPKVFLSDVEPGGKTLAIIRLRLK